GSSKAWRRGLWGPHRALGAGVRIARHPLPPEGRWLRDPHRNPLGSPQEPFGVPIGALWGSCGPGPQYLVEPAITRTGKYVPPGTHIRGPPKINTTVTPGQDPNTSLLPWPCGGPRDQKERGMGGGLTRGTASCKVEKNPSWCCLCPQAHVMPTLWPTEGGVELGAVLGDQQSLHVPSEIYCQSGSHFNPIMRCNKLNLLLFIFCFYMHTTFTLLQLILHATF
uniref:Uncharacterized protein n=1 Tax=Anser brachyrhynchus TaxID=132585 RepID=A0A8B9BC88_9AVES